MLDQKIISVTTETAPGSDECHLVKLYLAFLITRLTIRATFLNHRKRILGFIFVELFQYIFSKYGKIYQLIVDNIFKKVINILRHLEQHVIVTCLF